MFNDKEKETLKPYVTSTDANIFAVKNMQGMAGAVYARYSRAPGGFREVLLKEFIQEGIVDPKHADELIERVLIAYGDDSVGELEGAHVSFERISNIATKEIEDRRIGGSPIEQSTRYVLYDKKDEQGNWLYYRGPELLRASFGKQYTETMDFIFQTYTDMVTPLRDLLQQKKPISEAEYDVRGVGQKEKLADLVEEKHIKSFKQTYTAELRAKACDILRLILPVGTITNVGVFGNGRFFQNLLSYLMTTELPENQRIAEDAREALRGIIPQYIRRAARSEYSVKNHAAMRELTAELFGDLAPQDPEILPSSILMDRGETLLEKRIRHEGLPAAQALQEVADMHSLASMVYPYSNLSLAQLRQAITQMTADKRQRIITTYVGERSNRRDRPGRALEDGYPYTFDLITNFGVYKDLQRHRMNSQQRQLFTTKLGFYCPPELEELGLTEKALECAKRADELYNAMARENPLLAQYAVLHGHYVRWTIGLNDRAAMQMLELRSTPQGHPNYRLIAQMMHKLIGERSAWRGAAMKFVDHETYYWSRADSEARQRVKESQLEEKFKKSE